MAHNTVRCSLVLWALAVGCTDPPIETKLDDLTGIGETDDPTPVTSEPEESRVTETSDPEESLPASSDVGSSDTDAPGTTDVSDTDGVRPTDLAVSDTLVFVDSELNASDSEGVLVPTDDSPMGETEDTDPSDLPDTEVVDTELVDTEVVDTQVVDTEVVDTEVVDTEVVDTVRVDTERVDTVVVDTEVDPIDTDVPFWETATDLPSETGWPSGTGIDVWPPDTSLPPFPDGTGNNPFPPFDTAEVPDWISETDLIPWGTDWRDLIPFEAIEEPLPIEDITPWADPLMFP